MADYQLELRQIIDYPRCRIYREFIQTLIADRSIRTGGCSGLFYYVVLCSYANFRTSYRRIDGISYTVYPGEWICSIHQIPLLYLEQQKAALAETLVYSWSKSAGHMGNMTDESYAAIGVGLARGTDANGLECWYCVQLFLRSGYSISAVDKPATK